MSYHFISSGVTISAGWIFIRRPRSDRRASPLHADANWGRVRIFWWIQHHELQERNSFSYEHKQTARAIYSAQLASTFLDNSSAAHLQCSHCLLAACLKYIFQIKSALMHLPLLPLHFIVKCHFPLQQRHRHLFFSFNPQLLVFFFLPVSTDSICGPIVAL